MLPRINKQLFEDKSIIRVREVELLTNDEPQRHREKLARILLDEMYQFVALLDAKGTLLEVNRAALEGGGIHLDQIRGKPFWEARWWTVSQEIQRQLQEAITRAVKTGEFVRYDVEIYGGAAGEETIVIDFSLIPVFDHNAEVVFLVAEGRNITEKKRAEAEIGRKNEELQALLKRIRELDELKTQFFANVSHELRTPLALILGPAEKILNEGTNLSDLQRRDLDVIRRNAAMLLKHVNDLLEISKLDAGKMALSYAEIDLTRLIRLISSQFESHALQRQISYAVLTPERLVAQVDPEKVERVVLNLLSNAFKFCPAGGRIKCQLSALDNSNALIVVQDSGPGIRPEVREQIFERFRQADGGTTRQFGGTGLGLSIARDFVTLHGGTISVSEAPGGGALFQVQLPLKAPEQARVRQSVGIEIEPINQSVLRGTLEELKPLSPAPTPKDSTSDRPLVLVVEDNPEMRRFVAETFADEFRVETAENGQDGLEKTNAIKPDLIVTDIMMPKMGGDQMISEIRTRGEFAEIPIIVLSAKADDALRIKLLRNGAQDYAIKPFAAEEILARARNLISVKTSREQMRQQSLQLKESKEQMELFTYAVAHDLRAPLRAMSSFAHVIAEDYGEKLDQNAQDYLARINRSSKHLGILIDDLLVFSRIHQSDLPMEKVSLDKVMENVLNVLSEEIRGKKAAVSVDAPLPVVMGHRATLEHIINNLVSNALKFIHPGTAPDVSIWAERQGERVRFHVKDQGIGIAPEFREKIFGLFERLHGADYPGTGLGLAIVHKGIQRMGGRVGVESEPGMGSVFWIELQPG